MLPHADYISQSKALSIPMLRSSDQLATAHSLQASSSSPTFKLLHCSATRSKKARSIKRRSVKSDTGMPK